MRWVRAVVAAALVGTLAACAGSPPPEVPRPSESGVSLVIWADEQRAGAISRLATQWGFETGVSVTVQRVPFERMRNQFLQQGPQGRGPDLLLGANDWAGDFVASDLIAPVDLGSEQDQFVPAAVQSFTLDQRTYAVPLATENVVLFRNTTLAPAKPRTMEELADNGLRLKKAGRVDEAIGLPVGENGDAYHAYPFFSAAGGYYFSGPDAAGNYNTSDLGLTSPGGMRWADKFLDWGERGVVDVEATSAGLVSSWAKGRLAYWVTGPWHMTEVRALGKKGSYVAEPLPTWKGSDTPAKPIVGAQGLYLNARSEHQREAQSFLLATMNTRFMDSLYDADPRPPAWKPSLAEARSDEVTAAVTDFGTGGFPNLPVPAMSVMYEEFGQAEVRILQGDDPRRAMDTAQLRVKARTAG